MGLTTTHDAFNGSYTGFDEWRTEIARCIGIDYQLLHKDSERQKIREDNNLYPLLFHSDCDGELTPTQCTKIIIGLTEILPLITDKDGDGWNLHRTERFIKGCHLAISKNENIEFH